MVLPIGTKLGGDLATSLDYLVVAGFSNGYYSLQQFNAGVYIGSFVKTQAATEALPVLGLASTVNAEAYGQENLVQTNQEFDLSPERIQAELLAYAQEVGLDAAQTASLLQTESLSALTAAADFRARNYSLFGESAEAIFGARPDFPANPQMQLGALLPLLAFGAFLVMKK